MITLDADLYMLKNRLNISGSRLVEYTDKSVDEIIEAESELGNTQAADFSDDLFQDTNTLIKSFQLYTPENKFRILSQMNENDLKSLLPLLDKNDLVIAMNYFTQDKLINLLGEIPKDQLLTVVFDMFSPEDVMKLMPDAQLDKFLQSEDLDKGMVLKHLQSVKPGMLAQMVEEATGQPVDTMDPGELIKQISQLNPQQYNDALVSMGPASKREFIMNMAQEDQDLYLIFDQKAYTNMINTKQKPEITKSMNGIEQDQLMKMTENLPKELLANVLTQIDTDAFAELLINQYPDLLKQLSAG